MVKHVVTLYNKLAKHASLILLVHETGTDATHVIKVICKTMIDYCHGENSSTFKSWD